MAVVCHHGGTPDSGHIYCYVRTKEEEWKQINDNYTTVVKDIPKNELVYGIIYEKISDSLKKHGNQNRSINEKENTNQIQKNEKREITYTTENQAKNKVISRPISKYLKDYRTTTGGKVEDTRKNYDKKNIKNT